MKFTKNLFIGIMGAFLLFGVNACGQVSPNINNSRPSISRMSQKNTITSDTDKHGLKKGVTLMGGNPVAPAAVPEIEQKQYQTLIPVSVIHPNYAFPAPLVPSLPSEVKMSVPTVLSQKLTAYYFPLSGNSSFYIVGPNGMKGNAQVGQDGSYQVSLENKDGSQLDLSSTGACQGCAVDAASMYFPSVRKDAINYGGYHGPFFEDLPVKIVTLNSQIKTWGYSEKNNKQLAGFAYYLPVTAQGQGAFLSEVYVGSSTNIRNLAPWIFQNTFLQHKIDF